MKVIVFDTEQEAKDFDWNMNTLTGSISRYRFSRRPLNDTTVLDKAAYAALNNIPATLTNEDGIEVPNPRYEVLEDSYTLNKCALMVGDDLTTYDEEGNATEHPDVVELTEDVIYNNPEGP